MWRNLMSLRHDQTVRVEFARDDDNGFSDIKDLVGAMSVSIANKEVCGKNY
jgi:hypothetical protein